jgi:ABC-type glycerol-3-phosphate transport system substrate-binding protein
LIAAGEAPDIISVNGTSPDLREDNQIEDLMPYFSTDPEVSPDLYYEPAYTRSLTPDGKLWGLQWHVDPNFALMINPEVLDQQGYTELPDLNSLQQLGDFLKQFWIVRNGQQEMTTFLPNEVYGNNNSLMTMAYLNGADQNSYYNPETMTVTFNDPKIVEALEWMVQFKRENIDYTRLAEMDATLPEGTGRFQAGKSLMEPHVTVNLINNYKLNPDLMFAPMPSESLWIGGWSWGLTTAGSKENKEAAWELLKWMSSTKEGARSELEHFGWISGIKDHPALMEQLETSPPLQAAYEVLQNARKVPPQIPVPFEDELNAKWPEVMDGKLEPKAFLDHMTQYVQKLIDEKYKQ